MINMHLNQIFRTIFHCQKVVVCTKSIANQNNMYLAILHRSLLFGKYFTFIAISRHISNCSNSLKNRFFIIEMVDHNQVFCNLQCYHWMILKICNQKFCWQNWKTIVLCLFLNHIVLNAIRCNLNLICKFATN